MKTQTMSIVILLVLGLGLAACQDKLHTGVETLSDAGQGGSIGGLGTAGIATGGDMAGGGAGGVPVPTGGIAVDGSVGGAGGVPVPTGGIAADGSVGGGAGGVPVPAGGVATGGDMAGGGTGGLATGRVPDSHRPSDAQCTQTAPAGNCPCTAGCSSPQFTCTSDSACADAGANGRCINQGGPAGCGCTYDRCAGDTDCPSGQTCGCHGSPYTFGGGSTCVPGNCRVDADCGTGGYCSPSPAMPCNMTGWDYCQGLGYYCHTPTDWCMNDSDCGVGAGSGCVYSASNGDWECVRYAFPL